VLGEDAKDDESLPSSHMPAPCADTVNTTAGELVDIAFPLLLRSQVTVVSQVHELCLDGSRLLPSLLGPLHTFETFLSWTRTVVQHQKPHGAGEARMEEAEYCGHSECFYRPTCTL
jgi:hypothetical protein